MAQSAREFFETLESRVDPAKAAELNNSYLFDIEGVGRWTVDVTGGTLRVSEGGEDADCVISASEDTFQGIASGEQDAMAAYMRGRLKVRGNMGAAMKLSKLF